MRDVGGLFHLEGEKGIAQRVGRFGKSQNCGRFRREEKIVQLQEEKEKKDLNFRIKEMGELEKGTWNDLPSIDRKPKKR